MSEPTRLEAEAAAIRSELTSALGFPTFEPDGHTWRWPCAVCRSDEHSDYRPLVLGAATAPAWVRCEMCGVRDPLAQVEAITTRQRVAELEDLLVELHEVARRQARLIDHLNRQRASRDADTQATLRAAA